jgi:hypothetical protein
MVVERDCISDGLMTRHLDRTLGKEHIGLIREGCFAQAFFARAFLLFFGHPEWRYTRDHPFRTEDSS